MRKRDKEKKKKRINGKYLGNYLHRKNGYRENRPVMSVVHDDGSSVV